MKKEDLIDKYLQHRLTSEEKLKFEELFKNNIDFKKEVTFHTNLKKAVKNDDNENFRNLISNLELKARKPKRSYIKWLAAASVILLLGLTYFLTVEKKASSQELFSSYFEPYRNVIQPLERNGDQQNEKKIAFMAYDHGEYEKAILLFSKLYMTTKEPYYLFYKANALLKLERAKEAVPLLLEHLKTKDTLTEKSHWYLAMAYLKLDDKINAKLSLKKVLIEGKYKTKEAEVLLKRFK
ncbi:MAG: CDC27 family protein [Bacteroidota bacterium]